MRNEIQNLAEVSKSLRSQTKIFCKYILANEAATNFLKYFAGMS